MRKQTIFAILLCLIVTLAMSGCVKVVEIGKEDELTGNKKFDAAENVEGIWASQAVPELKEKAIDLAKLLNESNNGDFKTVEKYGHYSMGTSGELSFVVKGEGVVTEVNQEKKAGYMTVKLNGYDGQINVKLQIGTVYKGSAVRDNLSFIKYEDYTNQVDWAKISQSIHEVIDRDVVKTLDLGAITGKTISFVGAFSVDKKTEILVTPIEIVVK